MTARKIREVSVRIGVRAHKEQSAKTPDIKGVILFIFFQLKFSMGMTLTPLQKLDSLEIFLCFDN